MFTNSEYNKKKSNKISKKSVNIINKKEKKNNYGLTLMTLIIIIIVMLILAGVTVSLSVGDNGLIKRTKRSVGSFENSSSVDDNNIEEYSEYVKSLVKMPSASEITLTQSPTADMWTNGKVTVSASAGSIDTNKNPILLKKGENSKWEDPGTVENGTITVEENCTVYATFKNTLDKVASDSAHIDISNIDLDYPTNDKPEYTATTSTLTIRCKQTDGTSGIQKYEYSIDGGATWSSGAKGEVTSNDDTVVTSSSKTTVVGGTQYTFTGLEQGKTYQVKTRATDFVGHVTISETLNDVTTKSVPILVAGTDVTFDSNPSQNTWTKNSVTISATPDEKYKDAYVLQLSSDGTNFKDATNITVDKNGNVYARLRDKRTNADNSENYQYSKNNAIFKVANIDKTAPSTDKPDAVATTCKITVTSNQHDLGDSGSSESGECSGLDDSQTQYRILRDKVDGEDTSKITIDNDTGKVIVRAWQPTGEFTGLDQGIKYYAQTKATDKSGTGNTSVSELTEVTTEKVTDLNDTNVKFESNPSLTTWTKDDVAVKVSTQITDFTLQVAIGNGEWKNATMSSDGKSQSITVTVSSNQRVTARLYDGTNPGGEKFITLDHIDKLDPTTTAPEATSTDNSITLTLKQADQAANATNGMSGLDTSLTKYRLVKDANASAVVKDWQTSNVFSGLSDGTTYYFQSQVTDNAGNNTISAVGSKATIAIITATFDANGGTTANPQTIKKDYGSQLGTLPTTSRTGYTFAGWFTAASDGDKISETTTMPANNVTYYAHWTANTYTVAYNGNGATGGSTASSAHTYDVAKTLTPNGYTRTGYTFKGWATSTSGDVAYTNGQSVTNLATGGTKTLYAVWKDETAPTTTAPNVDTYTTHSVTVKCQQTDSGSGIATYYFSKDSGSTWTAGQTDSSYTFDGLTQNTSYTFATRAIDKAGNPSTSEKVARNTSLVPSGANGVIALSPSTSDWTNGSVTVTATTTQTGYNLQTSTDGTNWGKTNPLTFTANGTAYARLWDGYNGGTAASTAVTNIDKTAPTISSFKAGTVTTSSIPVTVSASDSASGIKSYAFYLNDKLITTQTSASYTYTGLTDGTTYKIKVIVSDNAGNTTEKNIEGESITTLNNDTTAPTISSFTAGTVTTSSIPVTVSASDSASGIKSYAFYLNDKLITTQTSPTYTYTGLTAATSYKIKVAVTDNAGNTAEKNIETESVADAIKNNSLSVGDTITYIPPTGQTYTVAKENSGYSSDQTFTTENSSMTTWKVWKINSNSIEIVSASATGTKLYLTGATGDNQGPGIMNNICKALYSRNNDITARSLDGQDIEEAMAENWGTTRGSDAFNTKLKGYSSNYSTTYTPSSNYVPNCYTTPNIISQQNNDLRPGSSSETGYTQRSGFTCKWTYYNVSSSNMSKAVGSLRATILGTRHSWLASRCVLAYSAVALFNIRYLYSGSLDYSTLFRSNNNSYTRSGGLSPVAELGAEVRINKGTNGSIADGEGRISTLSMPRIEGMVVSPDDWTNGNVMVTASSSSNDDTIQMCKDGKTWTDTNTLTFDANGTAYARLWDGYNGGTAASTAITNIDKTAPTISSFTADTVTVNSSSVTVSASDDDSGIKNYKFYLNDELKTTQTSSNYTYSSVYDSDSKKAKVVVIDNAGNSSYKEIPNIKVNIGDKIDYVPDVSSYTVTKAVSGASYDQTLHTTDTDMAWKVWIAYGRTVALIWLERARMVKSLELLG